MITIFHLELNLPSHLMTINISSLLHGFLMSLLSDETQSQLHNSQGYNPLKQRLLINGSDVIWEIVSLTASLGDEMESVINNIDRVYLEYHQQEVLITEKIIKKIDVKEMVYNCLNEVEKSRKFKLNILTPTSFKSDGQYEIFPDVVKIFRSIMLMFDEFNHEHNVFDIETLRFIENNVRIVNYNLKSTRFHLEGVKIPSFVGSIHLHVNGPPQMVRFVRLVLEYGSLSGIGVKTSLGMGKYHLQ